MAANEDVSNRDVEKGRTLTTGFHLKKIQLYLFELLDLFVNIKEITKKNEIIGVVSYFM